MRRIGPLCFLAALIGPACSFGTQGIPPPLSCPGPVPPGTDPSIACHEFHYPVAAVLSPDGNYLFVVNSDFNLEYNGGRVNVVNLGASTTANGTQWTGLESVLDPTQRANWVANPSPVYEGPFLEPNASVTINPFATSAGIVSRADGTYRLYVTVRGDGTLTWIDVNQPGGGPPTLSCGAMDNGLCDAAHRVGHDPATSGTRQLILPPLPIASSVDSDGLVAVAHQVAPIGQASLFVDCPESSTSTPLLAYWATNLSPDLGGVFRVNPSTSSTPMCPPAGSADPPHWYFLSRDVPVINHVRMYVDSQVPDRSYLWVSHQDTILGVSSDMALQSMVADPCNPTRPGATQYAYATARAFITDPTGLAHTPDSLIRFDITDPDNAIVTGVIAIPVGASRLVAIPPPALDGSSDPLSGCGVNGPTLIYSVSYDSRKVYIVDADHWTEEDQIQTQRGPYLPVFDPRRQLLYLVDFASMVIEVIDVRPGDANFDQVVFTLGVPIPPVMM